MIEVRDARPEDADAWRAIVLEAALEGTAIVTRPEEVATREQMLERFAREGTAHLVAEDAGEVLGVLGLKRGDRLATRHTAELGVTVAGRARGRGVGTLLLRAAEDRARSWGVEKMCLGVFVTNARAHRLYLRLGYVEEGVRRRQFLIRGAYLDEIVMGKTLGGPHG